MQRVVVIGARRRRQGIGEFVAQYFAQCGAEICGIVGTSPETVEQAVHALTNNAGLAHPPNHYTSVEIALRQEQPDIAVICSPYSLHEEHLLIAANNRCHCLCEKPLWWADEPLEVSDRQERTSKLTAAFSCQNRYLATITQWPYTLSEFFQLYPEEVNQPIKSFDMLLSPISSGHKMVLDSAPHTLSILLSLLKYGEVHSVEAEYLDQSRHELNMRFDYRHSDFRDADSPQQTGRTELTENTRVECHFVAKETTPRPAAYSINGKRVKREIALPDYTMSFVADCGEETTMPRTITLKDPLRSLVIDFLKKVKSGTETDSQGLIQSVSHLHSLVDVARRAENVKRGKFVSLDSRGSSNG